MTSAVHWLSIIAIDARQPIGGSITLQPFQQTHPNSGVRLSPLSNLSGVHCGAMGYLLQSGSGLCLNSDVIGELLGSCPRLESFQLHWNSVDTDEAPRSFLDFNSIPGNVGRGRRAQDCWLYVADARAERAQGYGARYCVSRMV